MVDLKKAIKERGFTLTEVATKLGITKGAMSSMLAKNNPTCSTLEKIATAIGCKVGDFFLDEVSKQPGDFTCMIEYKGECHAFHELTDAVNFICGIVDNDKE